MFRTRAPQLPTISTLPTLSSARFLLVAGSVALASLSPAFAADAQRQIDRTLAGRPNLVVELHNLAGNVTVAAASGSRGPDRRDGLRRGQDRGRGRTGRRTPQRDLRGEG